MRRPSPVVGCKLTQLLQNTVTWFSSNWTIIRV